MRPNRIHSLFLLLLAATISAPLIAQAKQDANQTQQETLKIGSEEVLLDVIVRDKKGRPVPDLKAEEIEIYEDGHRQTVTGFRHVNKTNPTPNTSTGSNPTNPASSASTTLDPSRQINLITLVFERLGNDGRRFARDATTALLNSELNANTMISVFIIDNNLRVLQPFTANRDRLRQAVELVIGGTAYSQFAAQSENIRRELENNERSQSLADASTANSGSGGTPNGSNFADAKFAEMTLNALRFADDMQRQQQGQSSIFGLLSLVSGQRTLSGRKTIIYFSEGLNIPPSLKESYKTTISAANRANVSFYSVDVRGLTTERDTLAAKESLDAAVKASAQQLRSRGGQPVTVEQIKVFDNAEAAIQKNTQNNLADLAESTGGVFIANTNDMRTPMQNMLTDLNNYYEVSYAPPAREYDGKFHSISIKVSRPDTLVQTRSGYFAVPLINGAPLIPYELPMLAALNSLPLPRDFDYRSTALHFDQNDKGMQQALVMEVPLANFNFAVDEKRKVYQTHFSLMSLIKTADGRIVERFSQDYPIEGPLDTLEARKRGNAIFMKHFWLAPGRYTMETVAYDHQTNKKSARRSVLIVPAPRNGLRLSSISIIKRTEQIASFTANDTENPLRFESNRIIPSLNDPLSRAKGSTLPLFFVIYPMKG
ncbi:MAG TPA: VWA domain-containing protein, partial [Blastocatellia bacterium]|nr:VWA domain-containing protein [Blastocatellia bacterium]